MAKTIKQLENGLRIKYLVHPKKYFLFHGNRCVPVNFKYQKGFETFEKAESFGNRCHLKNDYWFSNERSVNEEN